MDNYEHIDNFIKDSLKHDYVVFRSIKEFSIHDLELLSERAKHNNLKISIKTVSTNQYQGTFVQLIQGDLANSFLEWL